MEGFADDVEGLIAQENNAGVAAYTDKLRLGQKFGGALTSDVHTQPGGGASFLFDCWDFPCTVDCILWSLYLLEPSVGS